jgi:hypothetical protein
MKPRVSHKKCCDLGGNRAAFFSFFFVAYFRGQLRRLGESHALLAVPREPHRTGASVPFSTTLLPLIFDPRYLTQNTA